MEEMAAPALDFGAGTGVFGLSGGIKEGCPHGIGPDR
jgi:hypothetical protein